MSIKPLKQLRDMVVEVLPSGLDPVPGSGTLPQVRGQISHTQV